MILFLLLLLYCACLNGLERVLILFVLWCFGGFCLGWFCGFTLRVNTDGFCCLVYVIGWCGLFCA